MVDRYGPIS